AYKPPSRPNLDCLLRNWEGFVNWPNVKDHLDPVVRCAVAHNQFEAIHPFDDGNGRTGRSLLALQLVTEGMLDFPILYLSGFLHRNKPEYLKSIRDVTEEGKWKQWVLFMIQAFLV